MRLRIAARKTHKWLALLVGVQLVLWSLSGLYMTLIHIDTIHGDHLVRQSAERPFDFSRLRDPLGLAPGASAVRLAWVGDTAAFVATTAASEQAFDARSGAALARPDEAQIRELATRLYTGAEPIRSVRLITRVPLEIRGRTAPLWRVEFDHWNKPTFYLSAVTGALVARRHELWRLFDVMWMLHIMDYGEREDVNNWLLRPFSWAALLLVLSGGWLLLYAFPRRKPKGER